MQSELKKQKKSAFSAKSCKKHRFYIVFCNLSSNNQGKSNGFSIFSSEHTIRPMFFNTCERTHNKTHVFCFQIFRAKTQQQNNIAHVRFRRSFTIMQKRSFTLIFNLDTYIICSRWLSKQLQKVTMNSTRHTGAERAERSEASEPPPLLRHEYEQ